SVRTEHRDAWTRYPNQPIGAVYLVRQPGKKEPVAFTATCPHAGCFIGYTRGDATFACPCHTSKFNFDGTRTAGAAEVSPRDMDTLPVEIRPSKTSGDVEMVYVRFERFQSGTHDKIPIG